MNTLEKNYFDMGYMDTLANGNSFLHRLDPRAKLITTLAFIITVASFHREATVAMIPFFLYPFVLISAGGMPAGYFLKKVLLVLPFALFVGIFNPFLDREIILRIGIFGISHGWASFISILMRFFLTVLSALLLIALTGFPVVCQALARLGVPKPFVVQLMFFFRYIFVLSDEAQRMERARSLRSFNVQAMRYRIFTSLISHLLLRTLDRAERIFCAMRCRGFDGRMRTVNALKSGWKDILFVAIWCIVFIVFRVYNVPMIIGERIMKIF